MEDSTQLTGPSQGYDDGKPGRRIVSSAFAQPLHPPAGVVQQSLMLLLIQCRPSLPISLPLSVSTLSAVVGESNADGGDGAADVEGDEG
jgi:hypothetical protein